MPTIMEEITKLRQKSTDTLLEAERLEKLVTMFPNIQRHVNRWGKTRLFARDVNSRANRFSLGYNCGCCDDSPLELWVYIETEFGDVYSDPPYFRIGEKHWKGGDSPYPEWKKGLIEAGIPEVIIEDVSKHFKKCRQKRIDDAYDEMEEDYD
jgi:hypothetical protein